MGITQHSSSPLGVGFFFVSKKDDFLRPCIDNRGLHKITVKYRYPLPLIYSALKPSTMPRFSLYWTSHNDYHLVCIRHRDEWKTAFKTPLGHLEYLIMPSEICNAAAVFQDLINDVLGDFLNLFVFVCLDTILVFSKSPTEHQSHVRLILQRLLENRLYVKTEKCEFHKTAVTFLRYIFEGGQVCTDPDKIKAVLDWPTPQTRKQLQSFSRFCQLLQQTLHQKLQSDCCSIHPTSIH